MFKKSVFIGLIVLIFISCSTTYKVSYETYLKESPNKELKYSDDKFDFAFIPVANGIWFTIKNNTDKNAYLVWDKTYFIDPTGNSFKALDYDAVLVTEEVARKENNESPIPAKSSFARFTTPNTNLKKFQEFNTVTVTNFFTDYTYSNTFTSEFFDAGAYWPATYFKDDENPYSDDEYLDIKCGELKNTIMKDNNLGLGLYIKQNDAFYEYRFDFKVNQINIYEVKEKRNILKRELKASENFELQVIEEE
jgi:hypothetical protein